MTLHSRPRPDMQATISHSNLLRSREVYRYYRPNLTPTSENESLINRKATLLGDPALAAFAQLVAWRLDASLAIVSLIDRKYQYLLADSKAFNQKVDHGSSRDSWPGCANISIDDLPCGKTVTLPPVLDRHSLFVVPDLSEDTRFSQLPFVSGPPFMRFYAGAPIKSPKGITIGSLFIVDEASRPRLTSDQEQFLVEMAKNVMESMETTRAANECGRRMTMNRGITTLFDGDHAIMDEPIMPSLTSTIDRGPGEAGIIDTREPNNKSRLQSIDLSSPGPPDIQRSYKDADRVDMRPEGPKRSSNKPNSRSLSTLNKEAASWGPQQRDTDERLKVFTRAAEILHKSLQLSDGGGVVFLENAAIVNNDELINVGSNKWIDVSSGKRNCLFDPPARSPSPGNIGEELPSTNKEMRQEAQDNRCHSPNLENETLILGSCTATAMEWFDRERTLCASPFITLEKRVVAKLADLYPQGMLWSDEDLNASLAEEEYDARDSRGDSERKECPGVSDADILSCHFLGAQQVIFIPLKDPASSNCATVCFAWSTSNSSSWNLDPELTFCVAFGHCVIAEIAKLDTIVADQQKQDFIGSISHELRSPLHGILASVEFLGETRCDVFQKSLVDTVDSCGRTLLDTINHVLDFSKINSFENNWLEVRTPQHGQVHGVHSAISEGTAASTESRSGALLNIYAETNVAAVCEEVVEGLCVGQHFRGTSSIDFTDITAGAGGRNSISESTGNHALLREPSVSFGSRENTMVTVEVLLDIQKKDWRFTTQPGALRRVIMNIVGNALKYTEQGWVKIKLEAQDSNEDPQSGKQEHGTSDFSMVTLTVTDSGKGISKEFLRTRLYTAFAQEDVLASGTGLGLSLVQSIVAMLQGTINIQSQVGRGTEVKVRLPLRRAYQNIEKPVSSPMLGGSSRDEDDSIAVLCRLAKGKTIALYGFDSDATSRSKAIGETLAHYVTEWFGLTKVSTWLPSSQADILIADEVEMPALLAHGPKFPGSLAGPLLVILCSDAVGYGQTSVYATGGGVIEFVTKPIGPYKLAKALRHCLTRAIKAQRTALDTNALIMSRTTFPRTVIDESHEHNHEAVLPSTDYNSLSKVDISLQQAQKSWSTIPAILLVDDNKINLKLLEAFMKKRRYSNVGSASNGQYALNAVEQSDGYDIIFMDISMPILNGFEATRAIRKLEAERHERARGIVQNNLRSLIIALTGLASVRDRAEAFDAGVDLYMTKPVSLRDVGKLLDNWELQKTGNTMRIPDENVQTRPMFPSDDRVCRL